MSVGNTKFRCVENTHFHPRYQELLAGLRSDLARTFVRRGWSLEYVAARFRVPKDELDRLLKSPIGMILIKRQTLSRLLRPAYQNRKLWGPLTVRLLVACKNFEA